MCLRVFVQGDDALYQRLQFPAMRLGAAFQKINFLRDLQADYAEMGRTYFPGLDMNRFDDAEKKRIEAEIEADFAEGYSGILQLPKNSRFGVYLAYLYFSQLLKKIQRLEAVDLMKARIRIPDQKKYVLFAESYVRHNLNML